MRCGFTSWLICSLLPELFPKASVRAGAEMAIRRGFSCSGNFADQINRQQAVLQRGVRNLHIVGKLEHLLEIADRQAAMQELAVSS